MIKPKTKQRKQRRTIYIQTIYDQSSDVFYWFECPKDFDLLRDGIPVTTPRHGPFKTDSEAQEDIERRYDPWK